MKRLLFYLPFLLMVAASHRAFSQKDTVKKSSGLEVNQFLGSTKPANLVHVAFGGGLPGGDWAALYGGFGQVTAGYDHMFPSRFTLGGEAAILFGNKIKYDPVSLLRDKNGNVIGYDGSNAEIVFSMQAYRTPTLRLGWMLPLGKKTRRMQPEHGLHLVVKGGGLVHKTRIYDQTRSVAALDKTSRRGFDNLRAGALVGLSVAYWYVAPTGLYAFFIAAEPYVAFSRSQRSFNYNLRRADTQQYIDQGINAQLGFSLMLFQLGGEREYFYN